MIAIFSIGIWAVVINNTSNEEFPVKTLEDQQKACVAFIRLISTLGIFGHCAIWKYIYQNWMEEVQGSYLVLFSNYMGERKRRTKLSLYWVETREIFSWGKRVEGYSLRFIVSFTFLTLSLIICFIQKIYTNIVKLGYYWRTLINKESHNKKYSQIKLL